MDMKVHFGVLLSMLVACEARPPAPPPPPPPAPSPIAAARSSTVSMDPAERGHAAVSKLKGTLVAALGKAMTEGGPTKAIEVCSTEAPALARAASTDGVTVGRATRKPRNPANAASGWREEAIAHFEALPPAERGAARFSRALPDGATAYAEPLVIAELCLACHGSKLAPEVSAELARRYPDDRATGYALGDLRGVVWAELGPARAP